MTRKKHSWKFSEGGGYTFVVLLFLPLLIRLAIRLAHHNLSHWTEVIGLICFLFLLVVGLFLPVVTLWKGRLWKLPRSWYEACFALTILYFFYALFIFVTGYTPSKYDSHPIQRGAGFYLVYLAMIPLSVGLVAYWIEKRKFK
ncbi:MAG TPA: hypothetical protein VGI03_10625 [Verrucomicrobiae bacterium]